MADTFIILTKAEADAVKGPAPRLGRDGKPFAAIEPVELKDGTWVEHADVLADPEHAIKVTVLAAKPKRAVDDTEWKADPVKIDSAQAAGK